jgi:threonine/homoserine/homoserine lactone efflux protein
MGLFDKFLIVVNHLFVEWIVYTLFALLLATPGARAAYLGAKPWLDRACGALLGALGLKLLFSR